MKKRKIKFPFRTILISFLCLSVVSIVLFLTYRYLTTSEYFKIQDSKFFAGQNIFKVSLTKYAQELSKLNPDYQRIVLRRELPNRIIVDFKPRKAIARIKLSRHFYYIDKQGVLFFPTEGQDENLQLPLITGLVSKISHPRSGVKYNDDSLIRTLEFVDNLNKYPKLINQFKIKKINLANVNDVFFITTTDCRINLGSVESLNKNLSILRRVIGKINSDLSNIKYVDLRFKEPVIKYR